MRLGEAFRQAREAAGLTQERLANEAHLDRTYINMLERNRRSPSVKVFVDLCVALGVRPADLMAEVEKSVAAQPRSRKGRNRRGSH